MLRWPVSVTCKAYESIIQLAASLPNDSGIRDSLSASFTKTLWKNLWHPPISYLGTPLRYRTADGSNNNIIYPSLGAAGSHYARTVVGTHLTSSILPDPGLIFDTVLQRQGLARENPTKVSSHLFYFATIIIHDIFRTDDIDNTKVKSSSYLDLDTFTESRLLGQPPGVCALIIAFNRFHNFIPGEIAIINQNGRFDMPNGMSPDDAHITCGLYVNIILGDYLRTILNLNDNNVNSNWQLDPRDTFTSQYQTVVKEWSMKAAPADPATWVFGSLGRQLDGSFEDGPLVSLLKDATDTVAGAFGARNIPPALKVIEILDPVVAENLEALYGHPDNIELYPGLMAEEAKVPFSPGSGLCPGFTISETILSDAVTLVRGDRFYAGDYSPHSLTGFGFQEVSAFPTFYSANSVYALFPFSTPERMKDLFAKYGFPNGIPVDFGAPAATPGLIPVLTWQGVVGVLNDQLLFKVLWHDYILQLTSYEFALSGDRPVNKKLRNELEVTLVGNLAHASFAAEFLGNPLKDDEIAAQGSLTLKEVYGSMTALLRYIFQDFDIAASYNNRLMAMKSAEKLAKYLGSRQNMVTELLQSGKSVDAIIWEDLILVLGPAVADQSGASLRDFELLKKYTLEAFRFAPGDSGVARVAAEAITISSVKDRIQVAAGSRLFCDFITAGRDPIKFPEPEVIDLAVARTCPGLRRAPGPPGEMQQKMLNNAILLFLSVDGSSWSVYPVAKKVVFDM
ncbi:heme peroxidase [Coniella lustricola]|uniref:Heme peroxidase n=1 Tax=Coniella lustricola TaxID=2025994 RepID=A0A2T3A6D6_9PEZI|nr:heme peroxidase [Coniella lustricola]